MFRRKLRLSGASSEPKPAFDEAFWHWYADSYSRNNHYREVEGLLKPTAKKITSSSTAVSTIIKYFESLKQLPIPSTNQVIALLKSPFTQGDIIRTFHLIRFYQLSSEGLFITNQGHDKFGGAINYVGAENWENVMCYLDALLFSMFANLESFEPMLFISNQHNNYLTNQLSALLRLYVNLLRSGNLITTDLTIRICEVLKKLGFDEAMSHRQQDSATLFEFLTESLSMPLLTFKIDIKHGGKLDKDDQKFSKERILFVSIPEDQNDTDKVPVEKSEDQHIENTTSPGQKSIHNEHLPVTSPLTLTPTTTEGNAHPATNETATRDINKNATPSTPAESATAIQGDAKANTETKRTPEVTDSSDDTTAEPILLEECLEHYFNNSILVKRELERRATLELSRRSTDTQLNIPERGEVTFDHSPKPVERTFKMEPTAEQIEVSEEEPAPGTTPGATSASTQSRLRSDSKSNNIRFQTRTRSSTLSLWSNANASNAPDSDKPREVSLPAWMFLRLLPFYTDDNELDQTNESVAKSSSEFVKRRPILPICLKRYSFNAEKSQASRSQKRIVIPPIINLPQFVADDVDNDITGDYKLILESALCHRGTSITSGHFVSAIRKHTNNIRVTDEEAQSATWLLYDDMNKKSRVVEKTFDEVFTSEWPYMLFYRLVSMDESSQPGSIAGGITSGVGSSNSSINFKNSASSSTASLVNPSSSIIPPKGFKAKFWQPESAGETQHDTLTPIISASNSNMASIKSEEIASLNQVETVSSSTSSIPIPDVGPTDPRFVDVRNKYFWYVTDRNKHYHRELPFPPRNEQPSSDQRDTSFTSSVGLSPKVRRNSQWSDTYSFTQANASGSEDSPSQSLPQPPPPPPSTQRQPTGTKTGALGSIQSPPATAINPDLNEVDEKLQNLELSGSESNLGRWKRSLKSKASRVSASSTATNSPYINSPYSNSSNASLDKKMSPITLEAKSAPSTHHTPEHGKRAHGRSKVGHGEDHHEETKRRFMKHKLLSSKHDEYKKEKCTIM